jgi:hypothetical protein
MERDAFIDSIESDKPSSDLSPYLEALWYDAKGNWDKAHKIIQDIDDKNAAWIHAYLHRKEGDLSNADYWYHHAGKKRSTESLQNEWKELVNAFASAD